MTIANTKASNVFNANGVTRDFNLGFVYDENVSGISIKVIDSEGTETEVTSNYTIYNGVLTYPTVDSGLDPLEAGYKITIERLTPHTQTIDLIQQGPLDAETLEGGYDKLTLEIQELQENMDRAIKFPVQTEGETDAEAYLQELENLADRAEEIEEGVAEVVEVHNSSEDAHSALLATKQNVISDLEDIRSGASAGATALQLSDVVNTYDAIGTEPVNGQAVAQAVSAEASLRSSADINLQTQIDAITSAKDVADVVADYTELQNYDTSSLTDQALIKVLIDSTHNNTETYYRWHTNTSSFSYVGSAGASYTKAESDAKFLSQTDAASTYETKANAANIYETQTAAAASLALKASNADNSTIVDDGSAISTVAIKEQNNSIATKIWTGTKAQYDAIATKDNNTLYNVEDEPSILVEGVRAIGEIVPSILPLTDAGLHLLDGTLISGSGSYAAFVTYMAGLVSSYPDLFTSESDWQQAVADYDVCGKFVYDSTNSTVRLPKLLGASRYLIKSEVNGTEWYRIYNDGWCEQGGYLGDTTFNEKTISLPVPYNDTNFTILTSVKNSSGAHNFRFTKNSSSSITFNRAGDSNCTGHWMTLGYTDISSYKVEPLYQYIVIANSTKTEIEADIDQIATDLNGKADVDLTNCTKPHIVETYSNGTSWYRVYSDGWCEQGGQLSGGSASQTLTFLKTFADTNYSWLCSITAADNYPKSVQATSFTTTGCTWKVASQGGTLTDNGFRWEAKGYIS